MLDPALQRYDRQIQFEPIGIAGQRRLRLSRILIVGAGALGGVIADALGRAGVGYIRIVDRDIVELTNLQRQTLFEESDVAEALPKAEAAARRLRRANSGIEVEPVVADLAPQNVERIAAESDLILDGADNLETRYLLNDVAVHLGVPWIYAACVRAEGLVLPIEPGKTPCLRCLWPDPPPPGSLPTCETAGVLGSAALVVGGIAANEALRLLASPPQQAPAARLIRADLWTPHFSITDVSSARAAAGCMCCGQHRFEFLNQQRGAATTTLCGQNAVQISPDQPAQLDLKRVAAGLPASLRAQRTQHLLRFEAGDLRVVLFPDGRAIIHGTSDAAAARTVYSRYVGL